MTWLNPGLAAAAADAALACEQAPLCTLQSSTRAAPLLPSSGRELVQRLEPWAAFLSAKLEGLGAPPPLSMLAERQVLLAILAPLLLLAGELMSWHVVCGPWVAQGRQEVERRGCCWPSPCRRMEGQVPPGPARWG